MDHRDAKVVRDALMAIVRVLERTYQLGRREAGESMYNEHNRAEETPALSRR